MVTDNHYRWDFIQLADDPKPTPATSFKVTDGSTLYTSDDSKLYVWYKDQWYEKSAIGGGGGIPTTVIDTIWFGTQAQYDAIETKAEKTLYLVQEETTANTSSASPAVLNLPKINLEKTNILNNVDNITPEEEIKEPQAEEPEEEEPEGEEENLPEEPQEEETEVEEPEAEEQEVVEEPEEVEETEEPQVEEPEEEETKESEE